MFKLFKKRNKTYGAKEVDERRKTNPLINRCLILIPVGCCTTDFSDLSELVSSESFRMLYGINPNWRLTFRRGCGSCESIKDDWITIDIFDYCINRHCGISGGMNFFLCQMWIPEKLVGNWTPSERYIVCPEEIGGSDLVWDSIRNKWTVLASNTVNDVMINSITQVLEPLYK